MKQNLVLDLDNTLISAEALTEFPFEDEGVREKATNFSIHDMDGYYIIFERPYLQKFLDWAFENFNVSIFTAASQSYCLFVVENIILKNSSRDLHYIFFSDHCKISRAIYNKASKNLQMLWETFNLSEFDPTNTVIIDDYDEVYETQPDNCIHIKEFNILDEGSEHDTVLIDTIKPLLEEFIETGNL